MQLFSRSLTDADLMAGIRAGGPQRRLYENKLYEKYTYLVAEGVRKHRLAEDDCASAYSDAVLIVFDHIISGRFEGRSELKTYLYQIFTNKCVDAIRKKTTNRSSVHDALSLDDSLMQLPDTARSAVQHLIAQSDVENLYHHLKNLGDKCRSMILLWGEGYSDDEIAQSIDYNSAAVAKTSRLRCLDKLRERYRNAP
ncbi:RNA polymerase sigma factor [Spirosoma utsteinense]|uniref:RNA polymerase sigma-70 factor (ECF subfamily) n=1 Tax=Spirosoma utsteinense TaxID=2585773 RepID=A0ABR6WBK7_9BACT|nr:sigma-70 family RNA polymerase sigma factor [Spirosoma utsteinense]MBC3793926.1 RNA polymerase sigma-70 factor (ECF subfamily) [Spirosoma utsteinense]